MADSRSELLHIDLLEEVLSPLAYRLMKQKQVLTHRSN
jgi:hypothetical protein